MRLEMRRFKRIVWGKTYLNPVQKFRKNSSGKLTALHHLPPPSTCFIAAKQPSIPAQRLYETWSILDACMFFCLLSTILQSDFAKRLFKWYWNGWNSLSLATKENLRQIPVVPLLTVSEPLCRFVMQHNSMTVNYGTRERTCATNMMRSTDRQFLFLVRFFNWFLSYSGLSAISFIQIETSSVWFTASS